MSQTAPDTARGGTPSQWATMLPADVRPCGRPLREWAEILGVGSETVRRWGTTGAISPSGRRVKARQYRLGHAWHMRRDDVIAYLDGISGTDQPEADEPAPARAPSRSAAMATAELDRLLGPV